MCCKAMHSLPDSVMECLWVSAGGVATHEPHGSGTAVGTAFQDGKHTSAWVVVPENQLSYQLCLCHCLYMGVKLAPNIPGFKSCADTAVYDGMQSCRLRRTV
jgi:hypothetical protein